MQSILRRAVRALLLPLAALAVLACTGCAMLEEPHSAPVAVHPLNASEKQFLTQVAAKSMYEIEVSRLASRRALDPRVRAYANNMVAQQEQANAELIALMSAKGVPPPKSLTVKHASKLHRLAALPPSADFDRGYVRVVGIEDHASNIAMLERIRAETRDRDLRAWVDRKLPALRRQLAVAHGLASDIAA